MLARTRLSLLGVVVLTCGIGFTQCRVDDALDDRLWPCNENAKEDQCGKMDGRTMACWEGYCMPSCDPEDPPDRAHLCLNAGVLVEKCTPSLDDCPGELGCFRTDLLLNEGICVPFTVCNGDEDCKGRTRNTCATSVLEERYGGEGGAAVGFDHLLCLQETCADGLSPCSEASDLCLATSYRLGGDYPDICVPRCDSEEHCPPNFACARNTLAAGADKICIPGFPGVRCTSDQDCALGDCLEIGVSFKACTSECETDQQCELYTAPAVYFRCVSATPDGQKHCVNTSALAGFECQNDGDCPPDTPLCTPYSPFEVNQGHKECRPRCGEARVCPPRAGIPHVCLDTESEERGCYPGLFAVPCSLSSECIAPFTCESITLNGFEYQRSPNICTIPCDEDHDCEALEDDPTTLENEYKSLARPFAGYCGADGFCRAPLTDGLPCGESRQCFSKHCVSDPSDLAGIRQICETAP